MGLRHPSPVTVGLQLRPHVPETQWAAQGRGLECLTHPPWEKKPLFPRNIYSYLLGASEGGVLCLRAH